MTYLAYQLRGNLWNRHNSPENIQEKKGKTRKRKGKKGKMKKEKEKKKKEKGKRKEKNNL